MPASGYNGSLVIWAHGFQDAGAPVAIPEDQLCIGTFCLDQVITSLGFGFATNSYSKTGMAILQGKDDILDLVNIYAAQKGMPQRVYLVGASEGGIITALSLEQHPDVFSAGVAACGPVGDFPFQINYFGDARATFEVFFPGLIPGTVFNPDLGAIGVWEDLLRGEREAGRVRAGQPQPARSVGEGREASVRRRRLPQHRGRVGAGRPALQRRQPGGCLGHDRRVPVRQRDAFLHRVGERLLPEPAGAARDRVAGRGHEA